MSLMVSISGIRGIIGESLTPEVAVRYGAAFGEYCKRQHPENPTIVLGRDGRITGKALTHIVSSTLLSQGVNVVAIGIAPTPTIALAVEKSHAAGGIAITASHNPMEWNGMKFLSASGIFLDADENKNLWSIADGGAAKYVPWESQGRYVSDESWISRHAYALLSSNIIDMSLIQSRRFRVVVDCVNASGSIIVPSLLRELGCDVVELNCDMSGIFPHAPEPIPENLTELASRVKTERAHLGIAVDPDADRLVLISEQGEPYGEEYTIATAVKFILKREEQLGHTYSKSVVVNLSTTRAVDDIAAEFGARVFRSPVGEINVVRKMKEVGALVGGEGSGGVILPAIHAGRDAIVGIGVILHMLAEFGGPLSALKNTLPAYEIAKGKITLKSGSPDDVLHRIAAAHNGKGQINTDDGVKIDFRDSWVHLRKSNTEPIVRVIAEARTMDEAQGIVRDFTREIRALS